MSETSDKQDALETLQWATQAVLPLGHTEPHLPFELQVSAISLFANWSLWQKDRATGHRFLLGFWTHKLLESTGMYTPLEGQLLAYYWALVDTKSMIHGREVILRPEIPVMLWG